MKILGFQISRNTGNPSENLATSEPVVRKRKKVSEKLTRRNVMKVTVAMKEFNQVVALAEDIERPDRTLLYNTYEQIIKRDSHLKSQLRTAHFTIQQSGFRISKSVKESKDLKDMFNASWFTDFITHAVDCEFWGHSLIEFGDQLEGRFKDVLLIDRYHVIPEFQRVKLETTDTLEQAIPYGENLNNWFLVELGDKRDLGLLLTATVEIIYKKYSRTDWSQFNEKFGMPLLTVATDTSNDDELDAIEKMAQNFGSNGYIISSKDTVYGLNSATGTEKGHKKYYDNIVQCDDYISKLINGQSATSDEKAFVGSAEVQERILNTYTKGRLQRIQRNINDSLIPFLVYQGYPLQDCSLEYLDLLEKEPAADGMETNIDKQDEKKKPELSLSSLNEVYIEFQQHFNNIELVNTDKLSELFEALILKLHTLFKKDRFPDAGKLIYEGESLIKETASLFEKAFSEGSKLTGFTPDAQFVEKLTKSVWVFSGFKTERQLRDISLLLTDADGKLKPFNKFRDEVLKIHESYNINWLNSEYNQAVSSSQSAVQWKQYEAGGDRYYLQYRTAGDERVRSSHDAIDDVTLPISDPFWDEYYPPNGWGCRCTVKQVLKSKNTPSEAEEIKSKTEGFFKDSEKIFAYNPGKTEALFPVNHPYYTESGNKKTVNAYIDELYKNKDK